MTYIGCDPGQSGGIAVIPEKGDAFAHKMPETDADLLDLLEDIARNSESGLFAMLESVHSMPGQGVASSFKFGAGFGALRMALLARFIPFEMVTPQKWQKAIGCLTKGDKNVSKRKAQELFPSLKITHAIADALLIAEYCRRTHV